MAPIGADIVTDHEPHIIDTENGLLVWVVTVLSVHFRKIVYCTSKLVFTVIVEKSELRIRKVGVDPSDSVREQPDNTHAELEGVSKL